jgi:hypothetical protein
MECARSVRAKVCAILTAARSGEVRGVTWAEIDLKATIWTVPGNRMKMGREHGGALSLPVIALGGSSPGCRWMPYPVATAPPAGIGRASAPATLVM